MNSTSIPLAGRRFVTLTRPRRRSVTLLAGLGVLFLALVLPGTGCAPRDGLDKDSLPREVREALDRAARAYPQPLAGVRWSKVSVMNGDDHPLYRLQGTNERNNKVEMELTGAGRVIEVEEHGIPLSDVPAAVLETLKEKRPRFQPTLVEAIYQAENTRPVSFGFEGKDDDGKTVEVYVSADGKSVLN